VIASPGEKLLHGLAVTDPGATQVGVEHCCSGVPERFLVGNDGPIEVDEDHRIRRIRAAGQSRGLPGKVERTTINLTNSLNATTIRRSPSKSVRIDELFL
jgi:hypothetical protein